MATTAVKTLPSTPAAMSLSRRRRQELYYQYQLLDKRQNQHEEEEEGSRGKSYLRRSPFKLAANKSTRDGTGQNCMKQSLSGRRRVDGRDQGGLTLRDGYYPFSYSYHKYRMERAKKRQIFLKSYNLSFEGQRSTPKGVKGKLRRSVGKVKTAVLTVVAFAKSSIFSTCRRSRSTAAALPVRVFSPATPISSRVAPVAA